MKKALMGALLLLVASCGTWAQDQNGTPPPANAVMASAETSTAPVVSPATGENAINVDSLTFATPTSDPGSASAAAPAAKPKFVFGERDDYRWQLGVGVEFFRFQSNVFSASMVGLNTTLTYYTNAWFALEGNLVTGFAPTIYDREHVKMVGGGGGFRIGGRRNRFEPFAHGLIGGDHLQPQTANASRGALMAQAGIGLDYRVHSRLSFRIETDWAYTRFFNQTQNNFQGVAGAVLHF
jgi:hypothetical protein